MTAEHSARLQQILPLLVCPETRQPLTLHGDELRVSGSTKSYPIVKGRPVFVPAGRDVRIVPDDHVSNEPHGEAISRAAWQKGWTLNLGAGATPQKYDNILEFEYALFKNTDVSGDGHFLPFADNTFESVVTFNTFEHLANPFQAASEIYRVLKPGGWVFLHTAFLQPLHESPHHYYNCTEWGLRKWFEQFQIQDVKVSTNFAPGFTLGFLSTVILHTVGSLGPEMHKLVRQTTLEYWAEAWANPAARERLEWHALTSLSQEFQKMTAAGFQLEAIKPAM
jgi:SAM-dependent methyltransferase/uncharacterized protein YbaR (Trm112 family)